MTAVDVEKNEISVSVDSAPRIADPAAIEYPVDACLIGRGREFRVPVCGINVQETLTGEWKPLKLSELPVDLAPKPYVIHFENQIRVVVSFDCGVSIRAVDEDQLSIVANRECEYKLGFRSRVRLSETTIKVGPEIDEIAEALSQLSVTMQPLSPDNSYPSIRRPPPNIELAGETCGFSETTRTSGRNPMVLRLPRDLRYLYPVSTLCYYCGAEIVLEEDRSPRLEIPEEDYSIELGRAEEFQRRVNEILQACFYLDTVVRNYGPNGVAEAKNSVVEETLPGLSELYSQTQSERLVAYLETPFECIRDMFPPWHVSSYVSPEIENIELVPYIAQNLSLVRYPKTKRLDNAYLIGNNIYISRKELEKSKLVRPELCRSRVHAWMSDGVPIGDAVFKMTRTAWKNYREAAEVEGPQKRILIVINDDRMAEEAAEVSKAYADRSAELSLTTRIERHTSKSELRSLLGMEHEYFHFAGHSSPDGLHCVDGRLDLRKIPKCGAKAFLINSCQSVDLGLALLDAGSVGGVITTEQIMNSMAIEIGATIARLLAHGFPLGFATRLARHQSQLRATYRIVGNGLYSFFQSGQTRPLMSEISKSDEMFKLCLRAVSPDSAGAHYSLYGVPKVDPTPQLIGETISVELTRDELLAFLDNMNGPVLYQSEFYWASDLRTELDIF